MTSDYLNNKWALQLRLFMYIVTFTMYSKHEPYLIQTSWTALHKAFYDSYMAVEPYQAFFYCYLERSLNYQHLQRMLYRLVHCWQPSTMNHRNNECHNFKTHPWLSVRSVCVYYNGSKSLSLIAMTVFTRQFSWTLRAWSFPAGWWPPGGQLSPPTAAIVMVTCKSVGNRLCPFLFIPFLSAWALLPPV